MNENEILDVFIEGKQLQGEWKREVPCGVQKPPKMLKRENFDEYAEKVAKALLAKRIDAVCETKDETWIIEVKRRLNPSALGQVLVYQVLWEKDHEIPPEEKEEKLQKLRLGILCRYSDKLVEIACEKYGVKVFLIEKDK